MHVSIRSFFLFIHSFVLPKFAYVIFVVRFCQAVLACPVKMERFVDLLDEQIVKFATAGKISLGMNVRLGLVSKEYMMQKH